MNRSKSPWTLAAALGLALLVPSGVRAGSLGWLDEFVQQVVRETEAGARVVSRADGQAARATGSLLAREGDEGLQAALRRAEDVTRLASRADEPAEAALKLRFNRLVKADTEAARTFANLAPAERRLVVEMGEAAQSLARRYPGQADTMIRKLGVEGLAAVRAYGDDVAEVLVKEGPESVNVLRRTGRAGWNFFTNTVLPNKGKLAAAGVFALFLANPEKFVDTAGQATQFAVEQFAKAGVALAGAVGQGTARGLDRAVESLLAPLGINHPVLRAVLVAVVALVALGALLVVLGFPVRMLLRPFTWPLRLLHRPSRAA